MTPPGDPQNPRPASDSQFQHIVEVSTAIGLGTVFGSMACLEWKGYEGPFFRWHWPVLIWIAAGIFAGFYFWRQIWRAQSAAPGKSRPHLLKGWTVLAAASIGTFAYTIRTFRLEDFKEVLIGVFLASVVLSFVGWMIFRLMRAFERAGDGDGHP